MNCDQSTMDTRLALIFLVHFRREKFTKFTLPTPASVTSAAAAAAATTLPVIYRLRSRAYGRSSGNAKSSAVCACRNNAAAGTFESNDPVLYLWCAILFDVREMYVISALKSPVFRLPSAFKVFFAFCICQGIDRETNVRFSGKSWRGAIHL